MRFLLQIFSLIFIGIVKTNEINTLEVIYAVNAGGEAFTDSNGIRYRKDYSTDGTSSDYGKALDIKRVPAQDKILYQTERYSTETFGYTVPMPAGDGDYVLWLKFSEVWFNAPNLKVFDIALNDDIVIKDLDIFDKVGRGVAHDELVPFQIRQNKIIMNGKSSVFSSEVKVEFIKTDQDNPKVNAILIVKGKPEDVPELLPYKKSGRQNEDFEDEDEKDLNENNLDEEMSEEDREELNEKIKRAQEQKQQRVFEDEENENERKNNRKSKTYQKEPPMPKVIDPYASDETSYIIPILVTVGAFIPLLFCLCKL